MRYRRFIPLLSPVLIWLLSQAFLFWPPLFYSALAVGGLLIVFSVKQLDVRGRHDWPIFVVLPLLLFWGASSYAAVVSNLYLIQAIFLATAWFLFSYFKNLYYYLQPALSQPATDRSLARLENLFIAGGFLTVFSLSALWFVLPAFLSRQPLLTLPLLALAIALLFWQFSFLALDRKNFPRLLTLIIVILLIEAAWVFSLLPLNFNILALFLGIAYYFGLTLLRLKASGILYRRAWQWPLILSASAIILLLLTARWL